MFLDFGVFKKLHFRPFCAQRHSTATQPGASFCARLADFAKGCDRHCMDFFDHLSPNARKSVVRVPPSFFFVFFFLLLFTCWPCPSFLLIFNTFSNSFSDFPSYFVYQRRHFRSRPLAGVAWRRISSINVVMFLHKMLFTLRFWHTSPRRNHCCGLNPLCFTIDLKKKSLQFHNRF